MVLVLIVIGLSVVIGLTAGGSLRPFERLRMRWWGAALVGLALQGIPLSSEVIGRADSAVVIGSYGLLLGFAWVNRRLPALWLVMAGLVLNLVVIAANDGMPVSASAVETAGTGAAGLAGGGTSKHHLLGPQDTLTPLADVIGIPPPVGAVLSVGDLLLYAGVAVLVVAVMLGRFGEAPPPGVRFFEGYRGKHLPSERRFARLRAPAAPPAAGVPSGSGR